MCCCLYLQICDARGDGFTQIQTILGTFLLEFGLFPERGGGWVGDQIPNILKNSLSFGLDVFQEKLGRMTKSKHFEELCFVKNMVLEKVPQRIPKIQGVGGGARPF